MTSSSFTKTATVTASTTRAGAVSGGLSGDMETVIASLSCLPLDPVDAETAKRSDLARFSELLQTSVQGGLDILAGDVLTVGSTDYYVRAVEEWYWSPDDDDYLILYVEEKK